MDPAAVAAFQFVGQDIPWMVRRWAEDAPGPSVPGVGTTFRRRPHLDVRTVRRRHGLRGGRSRGRGVGAGDKVLIHADNCPETVIAWYACARLGAVGVTTNTRSVAAEVAYFASHSQAVGGGHPTAVRRPGRRSHLRLRFTFVTADNSGDPPRPSRPTHGHERLRGPVRRCLGASADPPSRLLCPSGSCSRRARRASRRPSSTPTPTRSGPAGIGPSNIDLRDRRPYLIYLPLFHVNAQSWSMFSVARRRRDRGAHAEVVDESLLGRRRAQRRSRTSR